MSPWGRLHGDDGQHFLTSSPWLTSIVLPDILPTILTVVVMVALVFFTEQRQELFCKNFMSAAHFTFTKAMCGYH